VADKKKKMVGNEGEAQGAGGGGYRLFRKTVNIAGKGTAHSSEVYNLPLSVWFHHV
jgi:hypothetical protein